MHPGECGGIFGGNFIATDKVGRRLKTLKGLARMNSSASN